MKLEPVDKVAADVLIEDFDGNLAKRITKDRQAQHTLLLEMVEGMKGPTTIKYGSGIEVRDNLGVLRNAILEDVKNKINEIYE